MAPLLNSLLFLFLGVFVGTLASFSGLGGGFVIVPALLFLGYSAQKAVGTSFLAILIIAVSAVFAHNRFANVDYRVGLLLGLGGIIGAQLGAYLVQQVPMDLFRKILAALLLFLAIHLVLKK